MADNSTAGNGQNEVKHNRDVAPGRETAIATESADEEARDALNTGGDTRTQAPEGSADHGRDPEYYGQKQGAD